MIFFCRFSCRFFPLCSIDLFENDQLFLILEFEFGGVDLENSNGTVFALQTFDCMFSDVEQSHCTYLLMVLH